MLRNYFSNNKDINMLAKQYLNNYIYNKKSEVAYILRYKQNIYNSNYNVIKKILNSNILRETDIILLKMRYKDNHTFTYISVKLELDINFIYLRNRRLLRFFSFFININDHIAFDNIYMLSPKLLNILEDRILNEYDYALLGKELLSKNTSLKIDLDYLDLLEMKKQNISLIKWLVETYLDRIKKENRFMEFAILEKTFNNIDITSKELGKIFYISESRIVQIWSNFKKEIKNSYLNS
ncbi:hypothetical protein [Megamonas funiformis]|uniref:RNA polymerase sigma-70 region 4 domain-containing protein n=1 Tax=Megamonas funiformis TaxID=437897 RepID=A0AAW4U6V3_9FIRM|nr:hypothetical protein [Megamonas funiformis]MCB6828821.1 hypothetical protein [Megamonas funiformis]